MARESDEPLKAAGADPAGRARLEADESPKERAHRDHNSLGCLVRHEVGPTLLPGHPHANQDDGGRDSGDIREEPLVLGAGDREEAVVLADDGTGRMLVAETFGGRRNDIGFVAHEV
jgi:hypothetical protein